MDFHENPWNLMEPHGNQWNSTEVGRQFHEVFTNPELLCKWVATAPISPQDCYKHARHEQDKEEEEKDEEDEENDEDEEDEEEDNDEDDEDEVDEDVQGE